MDFEELTNRRVLIVDDQKEIHDDFAETLNARRFSTWLDDPATAFLDDEESQVFPDLELLHARSGEAGCDIVKAGKQRGRPVAVAYVDIRMPPGMDGVETTCRMREIDADIEIVIMTAFTDKPVSEIIGSLERLHKVLYIRKPFASDEIQQITLSLIGKWNAEQELKRNRLELAVGYQRLEAVLDATGEAMAMYDPAGRLTFANQRYEQVSGLRESELKKLSPEALEAHFKERFRTSYLTDIVGTGIPGSGGELLEQAAADAGSEKRLFYRGTAPVRDSAGEVLGKLYVYRDVSRELELEQTKAELSSLRATMDTDDSFEGIVGNSPAMKRVYALMRQAAESDITVLLQGESGTGKELVTQLLHSNSARKAAPFVAINCAAIPETLMESELFGHERGAFTGATSQRIGAFERADGGTIFLDEISEMRPNLQAKLLRVLQEREVQRVGGSVPVPIDVRVIVASNKNLDAAVRNGDFRDDLLYRIAAFPIEIPPLRQRRTDIVPLADHFLNKHASKADSSVTGISTAAARLLIQYDWPGNVRELEHAIARAVLLEKTGVLQAQNLPERLLRPGTPTDDSSTTVSSLPLAEVERRALIQAFRASGNNITQAARALGINRGTLHRKLKKYGLTAEN
ncbi:MAG: sigma 54-interacting transcriptional regulator [Deltaproteobacteria bacterium]|nr:sigma 54-interacting transcriptional regulator [Deltaproteobacteria bacterium]